MAIPYEVRSNPFYRLLLPLICGIILQVVFCFTLSDYNYLIVCFFLILLFTARFVVIAFRFRWCFGFVLNLLLTFCGIQAVNITKHEPPGYITDKGKMNYTGIVLENPVAKKKSFKTIVKLESVKYGDSIILLDDKAILYIQKDSFAGMIHVGDRLVCNSSFSFIQPPSNPGEYDYRRGMNIRQIYLQGYLPAKSWKVTGSENGNRLLLLSDHLRSKLLKVYKTYGLTGQEYAVLSALTLGYRDDLDSETIQAFSASGAMHILSVSGLHVGIVFFLIDYLLIFLRKNKYGLIIKLVIILGFLWFYALIAGFSPSILRATVMFSFVIIGRTANREANIKNILAVSAFFLLLTDPFMILDVGFELSYLAVAGIVYLYPGIFKLIKSRYIAVTKTWSLISVSVAAQIATVPLSLYYFHQFPNYFLLANLAVIPVSTLVMYLAVAILIFSFFAPVALLLGRTLKYSVYLLNMSVEFVEQIPGSVTGGIGITPVVTLLLYVVIIMFVLYFFTKLPKYLMTGLLSVIVIVLICDIQIIQAYNQKEICVSNIRNCTAINFIDGNKNYLITNKKTDFETFNLGYCLKNNWIMLKAGSPVLISKNELEQSGTEYPHLYIYPDRIQFYGKKILILDHGLPVMDRDGQIYFDYIILCGNLHLSIDEVKKNFRCGLLIIDSSNSFWQIKQWEAECKKLNVPCHSVPMQGAFICRI